MEGLNEASVCITDGGKSDSDNSNTTKSDHLTRTSTNTREDGIYSMKVSEQSSLSPTVKEVVLAAEERPPKISFKAGQWVDLFIPGVETVGGFSMSSSPQELSLNGTMRLAIKYSSHPPAYWMHKSCKVGDTLKVRIGGDFFLNSENLPSNTNILLIAGGVGINPLSSIARFIQDGKKQGNIDSKTRVFLLFSAKEKDELLFKEIFEKYRNSDASFNAQYFVTGNSSSDPKQFLRRIQLSDIVDAKKWLIKSDESINVETYLCGPPSMIKTIQDSLASLNMKKPHFEQWW